MLDSGFRTLMIESFRELYGSAENIRVFRAPGRVNLIGEHTDYNLGFVMPVALDLATYVATAPAADGQLRIYSEHRSEMHQVEAASVATLKPSGSWTDYPLGVAQQVARAGFPVQAANVLIRSTVPEGSGLSSSAALEVSSALAFLNGRAIDPVELARLCQRSEHQFVGIPSGIMDQYVSIFGREHVAVEIDCRSLQHRYVELPSGAALVAVNTMVKHALAGSAYKDRVAECKAAVAALRQHFPAVESLRDVSVAQFRSVESTLPPLLAKRTRHVITEDDRVERFVAARGDLEQMGKLLVESHRSLQHDYEVSCDELDFLVETALAIPGVYGSRMTGGGFGGCTVTMLRPDAFDEFARKTEAAYQSRFRIKPPIYRCVPSAGAGELTDFAGIPPLA